MSAHSVKAVPRGSAPQTRYEALRARDDARRFADRPEGLSDNLSRAAELLGMLEALLVERLGRADLAPSGRCERCGHSPDDFAADA